MQYRYSLICCNILSNINIKLHLASGRLQTLLLCKIISQYNVEHKIRDYRASLKSKSFSSKVKPNCSHSSMANKFSKFVYCFENLCFFMRFICFEYEALLLAKVFLSLKRTPGLSAYNKLN